MRVTERSLLAEPVITGVAEAGIAYRTNAAAIDLAAEAAALALDDAGLSLAEVDGLAVSKGADLLPADRPVVELAEHLGLALSWSDSALAGGASALIQISHAAEAIKSGRCGIALVVYASTQASDRNRRPRRLSTPRIGSKRPARNRSRVTSAYRRRRARGSTSHARVGHHRGAACFGGGL